MTPERRAEIAKKAAAKRWQNCSEGAASSEPSYAAGALDCFAALAMTARKAERNTL